MGGDSGKLIRLGQYLNGDGFGDYEHAFVFLGNDLIVEAEPKGAKMNALHYDNVMWSAGKFDLSVKQRMDICNAARGYIGTPYSAMDYFALAAKRLHLGPLIPGLRRYVETSKHMICSQLVDKCYQDAGFQLFKDDQNHGRHDTGRWNGYVTPGSLYELDERTRSIAGN
jgi:hypothetical protein